MLPIAFEVDEAVRERLALAAAVYDELRLHADRAPFERRLERRLEQVRERFGDDDAARLAWFEPARRLYRAFGIDPTRRRPSSEALVRRILKGFAFPRVHPLVDAVNLCQLEQGLPYGLYDVDRLHPPVRATVGAPGEGYPGIRKGWIRVEGRPVLRDAEGPFGNPSSDSLRASVREGTDRVLVVVFAPAGTGEKTLERVLDGTREVFELVAALREAGRRVWAEADA
ncbi:MAG: hypothetical protein D6776_00060 [Planctomycetota bacterium]|nr:MAG: hypothetical protein D6776_00060 [Planctomycetota bacterium]